jgi:flagellar basal-body rod protein FlgB
MNDLTMAVVHSALHGLADRQRAIADNVANVQTPGFLAREVDFEASLQRAAQSGDQAQAGAVSPSRSRSLAPTRMDGNNVSLDDETVKSLRTNLSYQTMVEAMNAKFRLLRTATGQGV